MSIGASLAMAGGQFLTGLTDSMTNIVNNSVTNKTNASINQAQIDQQNNMQNRFEGNLTSEGLPKFLANGGGSNLGQFIPHQAQMFSGKNFMYNQLPGKLTSNTNEINQSFGRTDVLGAQSRVPPTAGLSARNRGFINFTSGGTAFMDGSPNNQPGTLVSRGLLPNPTNPPILPSNRRGIDVSGNMSPAPKTLKLDSNITIPKVVG